MRRYESFQIDRTIETWFRTNMNIVVYSSALVIEIILAFFVLRNLNPGTITSVLYAIFFLAISYTIISIGFIAAGKNDIASKLGAKL